MLPFRELLIGYGEASQSSEFAISRHDVEFDPVKALEMAKIEHKFQIRSSYFFQVSSDAYNLASEKNRKILFEIGRLGHEIGLHLYVSHLDSYQKLIFDEELDRQSSILSALISRDVKCFSVHRPRPWFLEIRKDSFGGMINAYGPSFFEYTISPKKIKYYADSTHQWNYGEPKVTDEFKKYQILTHPDEWFEFENTTYENYILTYKAHCARFNTTLMQENKRFSEFGIIE
jgi:hypothetical protein